MLKAIIIDDEPHSLGLLALQISNYCSDKLTIVAQCSNGEDGLLAIHKYNPDLVFLDIEMPRMNGFQMLEQLSNVRFNIIFTTAYDKFALKAFKFNTVDYLLKPINLNELLAAVEKVQMQKNNLSLERLDSLQQTYVKFATSNKIPIPHIEGFTLIETDDIVYCKSDSNYTEFHLIDNELIVATKTLKEVEETLEYSGFFRIHKQYLINLKYVKKYVKTDGGHVVMHNNTVINIARNRRDEFVGLYTKF